MTLAEQMKALGEDYAKEYRARVAAEKQVEAQQEEIGRLRGLILSFCKSLCLCDHMGDVGDEIDDVLKAIGQPIKFSEEYELYSALDKLGVKTLRGH